MPPPGADTQAKMYDALTPLFDNVNDSALNTDFKSELFGVSTAGPGTNEPVPFPGVTITRDSYDVPHVDATTHDGGVLAAGWIAHRRRVRDDQYHQVQHVAEVAQQALLTPLPDRLGPAALAGWYVSATEEALVGADFYEAIAYKDQVRWILGDVKGKGIDALRLSAVALGAFREAGDSLDSITEVAARLDHRLVHHLGDEDFVTAVLADISDDGTLRIACCGHPPALLVGAGGARELGRSGSLPLGLGAAPTVVGTTMHRGERLLLYTDGLIENGRRDLTDGLNALAGVMRRAATLTAEQTCAAVRAGLLGTDARDDDVCLLAIRLPDRSPRPPAGR